MMGYNYGVGYWRYPWLGIVAMCPFCIGIGCFLSYLTMKTGSIWPAALGHGAVNAAAGLPVYGLVPGVEFSQVLGPMSRGLIACLPMLAFGLLCAVGMAKTKKTA